MKIYIFLQKDKFGYSLTCGDKRGLYFICFGNNLEEVFTGMGKCFKKMIKLNQFEDL